MSVLRTFAVDAVLGLNIAQAPADKLDYSFDWTSWLQNGETISTSVWSADTGATVSGQLNAAGVTSTFVQQDTPSAGASYRVYDKITTSAGRIATRSFLLRIQTL